jgi:hypothetical protein
MQIRYTSTTVELFIDPDDTDGDGLPDAWETGQFGDLTTSNGGDDNFDGDRNSDWTEYLAGTAATNADSYFRTALTNLGSGTIAVTFDGVADHSYLLETSTVLSNAWTYGDSAGPLTADGPQTLRHTVPGNPPALFGRVGISEEPVQSGSALYVPEGYALAWGDQFSGSVIDTGKWVVASLRDPVTGDLVPGADGDHLLNDKYSGYVTEEDSYVEEGSLILLNQKRSYTGTSPAASYDYTSGWIMSMHRGHFNKGYLEIRAKFPSGDKVWPAFWLVAEDLVWGPEWDMWEYFGDRAGVGSDIMGNHLAVDQWPNVKWDSSWIHSFDSTYDCEAWHVYGFEWTASNAVWSIDGTVVHTLDKSASKDPAQWPESSTTASEPPRPTPPPPGPTRSSSTMSRSIRSSRRPAPASDD